MFHRSPVSSRSIIRKFSHPILFLLTLFVQLTLTANPAFADGCVKGNGSFTLYAGQDIDVGEVTVQVNGDNLEVKYTTTDGWMLTEMHLWVDSTYDDYPQTRQGNPVPGHFPYSYSTTTGLPEYTFSILLDDLSFSCPASDTPFYMGAYAQVMKWDEFLSEYQVEGAWSDGDRYVDRGNWATYSTFTLWCDCDDPEGPSGFGCETAFGYDPNAQCFIDIDEDEDGNSDFNRWGWTIGPIMATGLHTFDLYAGAGQCDHGQGTMVGSLAVNYDGTDVTVTYNIDDPYFMEKIHFYVGCEILPSDGNGDFTVAPGQYPYIVEDMGGTMLYVSDPITVDCPNGFYVVAHSNVCGFPAE